MRRHRFEPAALVLGLVLLFLSTAFILDACRVWDLSRPDRTVPMAAGGIALAALTGIVTQAVRTVRSLRARRRNRARPASGSRPGAF